MKNAAVLLLLVFMSVATAQTPDPNVIEQQKKEVSRLDMMNGQWRGEGWIFLPTGKRQELTQTERVGPLLDGAIKVIEGRGYDADGKTQFNAFAVISYDSKKKQLVMRSYAQGRVGDFPMLVTKEGYTWEIPAGPAKIRYTSKISDGDWLEYGERIVPDRKPIRFFEMKLKRLKKTDWPAADKVDWK